MPKKNVELTIRFLADKVIATTPLELINTSSDETYSSTVKMPYNTNIRVRTKLTDWHYENGVMNLAMLKAGETLIDSKFTNYTLNTYKFIFENLPYFEKQFKDPTVQRPSFRQFFDFSYLDNCGTMGAALSEVHALTRLKVKEYQETLERTADYILNEEFRLADGTWCREYPRKKAVWADDLYMGTIFLSKMGNLSGERTYFDEAARQIIQFTKHLMDTPKHIYYHCYFHEQRINNGAHWGRANGWVMMAQAELLDVLPLDQPKRDELVEILTRFITGFAGLQCQSGLWHQLLDKNDSYPESSCTAMFTYFIAKAVNRGWIDSSFSQVAWKGWQGLYSKVTENAQVTNICVGTHVEMNIPFYYNRPRSVNDTHGLAATILAGCEMYILQQSYGAGINPRDF